MNLYHTDVDLRIVERIETEFGRPKNLLVTPDNYKLVRYNWQENDDYGHPRDMAKPVFGFEKGSNLDQMVLLNRNGFFHHFTKYAVEGLHKSLQSGQLADQLAYVHIDQHLDFSHQYMHANFVGRIFCQLGIPVYILARALGKRELDGSPTPSSEYCLIKPIKEDGVTGSFNLTPRTKAVYTTQINEHYVYLSTDLDAFPFELFLTEWSDGARKDFGIETYKRIIEQITKAHKVMGVDFTGLSLKEHIDPKRFYKPYLGNIPPERREEYIRRQTEEWGGVNQRNNGWNNSSLDNLVDLIKFMQIIIERKDGE